LKVPDYGETEPERQEKEKRERVRWSEKKGIEKRTISGIEQMSKW
jgi:hypothetical protein